MTPQYPLPEDPHDRALHDELRAAYDAGVDMGERGFAEDQQELDIGFAVHLNMRARRTRAGKETGNA